MGFIKLFIFVVVFLVAMNLLFEEGVLFFVGMALLGGWLGYLYGCINQ